MDCDGFLFHFNRFSSFCRLFFSVHPCVLVVFEKNKRYSERLKGCEAEVAELLDEEWKATTFDWMYEYAGEDGSLQYGGYGHNDTPFDQQQQHHHHHPNGNTKRAAVHMHPDVP